jgi:thiol-disulfide isomerase/thioredoxin
MKSQKNIIITAAFIVVLSGIGFFVQSSLKSEGNPNLAAQLSTLKQLDGSDLKFSLENPADKSTKKKFVILHFWASWCSPCQTEMPTLFATYPKLKDKFQVILISADEKKEEALAFLKIVGIPPSKDFEWLDVDKKVSGPLGIFKLPETLILDSNLKQIRKIAGPMEWADLKNLDYLNSLK